ncbi:MAG: hypothetical protein LBB14_00380 [Puniceicoccales bacterium]|nr:hypothetical protein [Puniceicoccales bacterium]
MNVATYGNLSLFAQNNILALAEEYNATLAVCAVTSVALLVHWEAEKLSPSIGVQFLYYLLSFVTFGIYYAIARGLAFADVREKNSALAIFLRDLIAAAAAVVATPEEEGPSFTPAGTNRSQVPAVGVSLPDVPPEDLTPDDLAFLTKFAAESASAGQDQSGSQPSPAGQSPSSQPAASPRVPTGLSSPSSSAARPNVSPVPGPNLQQATSPAVAPQVTSSAPGPSSPSGPSSVGTVGPSPLPQFAPQQLQAVKAAIANVKTRQYVHSVCLQNTKADKHALAYAKAYAQKTKWDEKTEGISKFLRRNIDGFDPSSLTVAPGYSFADPFEFWAFAEELERVLRWFYFCLGNNREITDRIRMDSGKFFPEWCSLGFCHDVIQSVASVLDKCLLSEDEVLAIRTVPAESMFQSKSQYRWTKKVDCVTREVTWVGVPGGAYRNWETLLISGLPVGPVGERASENAQVAEANGAADEGAEESAFLPAGGLSSGSILRENILVAFEEEGEEEPSLEDRRYLGEVLRAKELDFLANKEQAERFLKDFARKYVYFCMDSLIKGKGMVPSKDLESYLPEDVGGRDREFLLACAKKFVEKVSSETGWPHYYSPMETQQDRQRRLREGTAQIKKIWDGREEDAERRRKGVVEAEYRYTCARILLKEQAKEIAVAEADLRALLS